MGHTRPTRHAGHTATFSQVTGPTTDFSSTLALALLDETFRHHHRFARWLEYEVPEINLPPDIYEVGLERIDTNQAETQAAS